MVQKKDLIPIELGVVDFTNKYPKNLVNCLSKYYNIEDSSVSFYFPYIEYFSQDEMIEYFDVKNIHKSPARLDHKKLLSINSYYLNTESDSAIIELISLSKGVEIPIENQEKIKLILEHVKTNIFK